MSTSRPIFWHTVTYSSPGLKPPVYLAGSFTEPPWVPQGMEYTQQADGEFLFTKQVHIAPEREYQYKFRQGDKDWVLDEKSPIVTDSAGNQNNSLCVEWKGTPTTNKPTPGKVLNERGIVNIDDIRSNTPVEKVANTAAEVADTAQKLDKDEAGFSDTYEGEYSWKEQEPIKTPLFAHESFGAYQFVDDGFDHAELEEPMSNLRLSRSVTKDLTPEEVDINDPTIEKFPSERLSVMDTLRKIQSSSSQDNVLLDGSPLSPAVSSRKSSFDSAADDGVTFSDTLSPTTSTASRRRENRLSHSSFSKTKSAVSLGSIAEEPKAGEAGSGDSRKPRGPVFDTPVTPPSDENDGVVMKDAKVTLLKESTETHNHNLMPKEQLVEHPIGPQRKEDKPSSSNTGTFWENIVAKRYNREKGPIQTYCNGGCDGCQKRDEIEDMDNPYTHGVLGNDRAA